MVFPLICLVGTTVAGIAGIYKGYQAVQTNDQVDMIVEDVKKRYAEEISVLNDQYTHVNQLLDDLGKYKLQVNAETIYKAVSLLKKLHKVNLKPKLMDSRVLEMYKLDEIKTKSIQSQDIKEILVGGGSTLVYSAIGATSLVSTALAPTTVIGTLIGASAESTVLSWFGYNTMTYTAFSVGGGAIALGMLTLGPTVAIMGFSFADKAEKKMTAALKFQSETELEIEKIRSIIAVNKVLENKIMEYANVLEFCEKRLLQQIEKLERVILSKLSIHHKVWMWLKSKINNSSYNSLSYSVEDESMDQTMLNDYQQDICASVLILTMVIYKLLHYPLIDADGKINDNFCEFKIEIDEILKGVGL